MNQLDILWLNANTSLLILWKELSVRTSVSYGLCPHILSFSLRLPTPVPLFFFLFLQICMIHVVHIFRSENPAFRINPEKSHPWVMPIWRAVRVWGRAGNWARTQSTPPVSLFRKIIRQVWGDGVVGGMLKTVENYGWVDCEYL